MCQEIGGSNTRGAFMSNKTSREMACLSTNGEGEGEARCVLSSLRQAQAVAKHWSHHPRFSCDTSAGKSWGKVWSELEVGGEFVDLGGPRWQRWREVGSLCLHHLV